MIRASGADYYNPDEATRRLAAASPHVPLAELNALAWREGRARLARAIETRSTFAFETTLGGSSITELLLTAPERGVELHVWYVALVDVDAHLGRVRARVAADGHDIPEDKVRARYDSSRLNLVRLLPAATTVRVFDNSTPADEDGAPHPILVLELQQGRITRLINLAQVPAWAKPIVAAALRLQRRA